MSRLIDAERLQRIGLFAELEPSLLDYLAAQSQLLTYAPNESVFYEGDALPACLYLLVTGSLRIAKVADSGKETILRLLPAGEVFAAPALFGNGRAPATATAIEPVEVLTVQRQALLEGFRQAPELALHLLVVFNQRLQQLHHRVHGLASERAIVRLIHYLEHCAANAGLGPEREGEPNQAGTQSLHLTHYQIARSIGITYEECVRLFKQLKPAVSYRRGGNVTILDWQQLHDIAQRQSEGTL
ncbi:cAMP-binding domain protein [Halomicronema hongdechloris C2206]|uniref:cAMP-binding domain protein n=1 Tax=Halomicronema hongdechloris C2206 TaxID=1641165 RepID=A0A1Z3HJH9_9CYAN|nr:Crp/Fnr family transcriptional regulator [Halomicronema hongdechloris]ASC70484.1 cAMP-binding domain protein [Halomicronema hongdechloris C2206]